MTYENDLNAPYVVLVALTFDETGVNALREAARIAELHPASQLHVVHVVAEVAGATTTRDLVSVERRLERAPDVMRKYVEHVWAELPRKVVGHLRVGGSPSRAILQTAADVNAELVVVGTHRRSGVKKFMLGSVAEQVVRHAHCPVFIAMPKDYSNSKPRAEAPEPVCPRCLEVRKQSQGQASWCDRHGGAPARVQRAKSVPPPPPARRAPPAVPLRAREG
jgi:nucleotide-binding universal stress UspA family protein